MDKSEFIQKMRDELQTAIWKQEIEIAFLNDELAKLEDDINKTSNIVYVTAKEGRKDIGHLQQEKVALQSLIKQQTGVLGTLRAKLDFINEQA